MVETKRLTTAEDLAKLPTGRGLRYELVNGELRTMAAAGGRHGAVVGRTTGVFWSFLENHDLGVLFGAETGFMLHRNPDHVRCPDVAFVTYERLPDPAQQVGFLELAPDFVVEVVSPTDAWTDVLAKVQEWLDHGTRVVWVIDPAKQNVSIWRTDGRVDHRREEDDLDAEPVLPGFRGRVADLFPR